MKWDTNKMLTVLGVAIGLAGGAVAAIFVVLNPDSEPSLELQTGPSVPLMFPTPASERIEILLDDVLVEQLWLTKFKLVNNGSSPIRRRDFDEPIQFSANGEAIILRMVIEESSPPNLKPDISRGPFTFDLEPLLLNEGDSISFNVLSLSTLEGLLVSSRIAGLRSIDVKPPPVETDAGSQVERKVEGELTFTQQAIIALLSSVIGAFVGGGLLSGAGLLVRRSLHNRRM